MAHVWSSQQGKTRESFHMFVVTHSLVGSLCLHFHQNLLCFALDFLRLVFVTLVLDIVATIE
jgi:hypothetical protein